MDKRFFFIIFSCLLFYNSFMPTLMAVGDSQGISPVEVVLLMHPHASQDALNSLIMRFNNEVAEGYNVTLQISTTESQNQHDNYAIRLANKDDGFDIIVMDVIWLPEFIEENWIEPLDDILPQEEQAKFLSTPIFAAIKDGKVYAIPWSYTAGVLFYRTDILKFAADNDIIPEFRPPQTWSELHDWTLDMLNDTSLLNKFQRANNSLEGFIWQGREYEGLVCNFIEYLGGIGVNSFLNEDQTQGRFNTPEIEEAIKFMKNLIDDGVSPESVLTYREESSRAVWDLGNSIFHRNWPYVYRLNLNSEYLNGSLDSYLNTSEQVFGITSMPHKDDVSDTRTGCLGGHQLGVNIYSKYKNEAKEFVSWLSASEQQKEFLIEAGQLPTREAVYTDPDVLSSNVSYVSEFLPIFKKAIPRPIHTRYPAMSAAVLPHLHKALLGSITVEKAVINMDDEVNAILGTTDDQSDIIDSFLFIQAIVTLVILVTLSIKRKKRLNTQFSN